jgi:hypothetical protein
MSPLSLRIFYQSFQCDDCCSDVAPVDPDHAVVIESTVESHRQPFAFVYGVAQLLSAAETNFGSSFHAVSGQSEIEGTLQEAQGARCRFGAPAIARNGWLSSDYVCESRTERASRRGSRRKPTVRHPSV